MSGPINPNVESDTEFGESGSYESGSVTVGTTAVAVCTVPGGYNGGVTVHNGGTVPIFLGGSGVTTTNGLAVPNGTSVTVPGGKGIQRTLYGVSGTAGQTVTFLLAA